MKKLIFIMMTGCLFMSCSDDYDEDSGTKDEWGFRHDRDSKLYTDLGSNSGDYTAGENYPDFSPVGCVFHEDYTASGVLINEKWVLTAAHNFITDTETPELLPEDLSFRLGSDYNEFDKEFLVENVFYHPAWVENIDSGDEYGFDIALIELQESVQSITPALYHKDDNETLNSKIFLSGFGDYEPRFDDEWSKKRAWENTLDRLLTNLEAENTFENESEYPIGGLIGFDYDSPDKNTNTLANTNEYLGAGDSDPTPMDLEGTPVEGDSGGPCFAKIDNQWQVIGVCSHSDIETYGAVANYTRVSTHKDWIYDTINTSTIAATRIIP